MVRSEHMKQANKSVLFATLSAIALTGCTDTSGLDFDFRRNNYNTAEAAQKATADRPQPDANGIISYPTYRVAVARRGDTLKSVAERIGQDPASLAKYNGTTVDARLREGEVVSIPGQTGSAVPAQRGVTTAPLDGESDVNITALAQSAIGTSPTTPRTSGTSASQSEPLRHRVERGETAYTIARLYQVSVRSLAEWNGLGSDLSIREGQQLIIPVAKAEPVKTASASTVTAPGTGTPTPTPPSAKAPLPVTTPPAIKPAAKPATAPKATQVATPKGGQLAYPVQGKIIREYVKGKTDGIDLSAAVGSSIVAAEKGVVAAITADADQVPIVVIKHDSGLLTVYANVGDIKVAKGAAVTRGQRIGSIRDGNPAYLHFEVRRGFDSVDPMDFLK